MNIDTDTVTACPECNGPRIEPREAECIAVFGHCVGCALARQERDTFDADTSRLRKYGTAVRHRPATAAERRLLRASGVELDPRAPIFARVSWAGPLRTRSWTGANVVACDALVGAS